MLLVPDHRRRVARRGRPTGLPEVAEAPWGTHICHFYRTADDLLDLLIPWFRAGLEANEQCLWVTSEPLPAARALEALKRHVPELGAHIAKGSIEIVDHHDWYTRKGDTLDDVLAAWTAREEAAVAKGFDGLRISGNTYWVQPDQWEAFEAYEAAVHEAFHGRRILALCSYSLERCNVEHLLSVLQNHAVALIREHGAWRSIRTATALMATYDGLSMPGVAPPPHLVEFYLEHAYPAERVAAFTAEGLEQGEAVVLIVTRAHLELATAALERRGHAVAALRREGTLVVFDAEEQLARLIARDFAEDALTGGPVGRAVGALLERGPIRVYGEMVDLLCRRNRVLDAVRLEEKWNEILQEHAFPLLCTYGVSSFEGRSHGEIERICSAHGEVLASTTSIPPKLLAELQHQQSALATESQRRRELEEERVRLYQAERKARERAQSLGDQLARLQRVTSALSEAATPTDIGGVVVQEMREALGAEEAVLVAPTPSGEELSLLGHAGLHRDADPHRRLPIAGKTPVASAFRTRRAIWSASPQEIVASFPDLARPPQAVVALPLTLADRTVGALAFGFHDRRALTASFRALVEDLVRQVGLALDRALLYEEAQRTRDRLQLLSDATAHFSEAGLDVAQVLDVLATEVSRAFAEGCVVFLVEEGEQRLDPVAVRNVDPAAEAATLEALATNPVVLGEGISGKVALTGAPLRLDRISDEILRDRPASHRRLLDAHPVGSCLAVALRSSGRVLGVVTTYRGPQAAPFGTEDQELLQELADRAALSIDNARLYERAHADRQRAEAANRAKDEFLAMLGHELRNPLSPIVTALQLMRLRGGGHFANERAIMERQVKHMVRLVDDLLDVSRITRGKVDIRLAPIELADIVRDAIEVASPILEERSHTLTVEVPEEGLEVDADAHRLTQVVANLLTNAAKYTPSGGNVVITTCAEAGRVRLSVRDNGIGIDPGLLPTIFDTFVQDRQTIDRSRGGLGLGLAIVRALVEMHGGTVSAHSAGSGQGSTFTIELPLARVTPQVLSPDRDAVTRVLVVDDNRDAAEVIALILKERGYEPRVAYDGPGALDVLDDFVPDVALLDLGMPGMDGFELADQLRRRLGASAPRLVAISGYGRPDDRARTRRAGFHAHVGKPVPASTLTEVLDRVLTDPVTAPPD